MIHQLGYAVCPCGFRTPLQPSTPDSPDASRKWIETGGEFPFFACNECKRLYKPWELVPDISDSGTLNWPSLAV
jgi:hypothetical protein